MKYDEIYSIMKHRTDRFFSCRRNVMPNEKNADNYINLEDAAVYLGISAVTLRGWLKKYKDLPAHKIGKLWKFKRSELDRWVQSGKSAL